EGADHPPSGRKNDAQEACKELGRRGPRKVIIDAGHGHAARGKSALVVAQGMARADRPREVDVKSRMISLRTTANNAITNTARTCTTLSTGAANINNERLNSSAMMTMKIMPNKV